MQTTDYKNKEEVYARAESAVGKSLRNLIPPEQAKEVEQKLERYGTNRKGFLGDLIEEFIFGIENNGRAEADFKIAGVELKSTPLKKHPTKEFVAKERLVFSMIDYDKVIGETWENSSFLEKNKLLLILFYLYLQEMSLLDYEFKYAYMLDLLNGISQQDAVQIRKDWEYIVAKIRRGEAHLLSEGDTYYLGACTKAKNSTVVRDQPMSREPAKPRAFSLKQTYLNYLIQKNLLGRDIEAPSIYRDEPQDSTIEEVVKDKFKGYVGRTDSEILTMLGWQPGKKSKNYKRLIANRILTGTSSNEIEGLEKANVTLRAITLESDGSLKESVSFPAFDYGDLLEQTWYDEESETMADFHAQLEMRKFLFVVFQKIDGSKAIRLKKIIFWNFPQADMDKVRDVWERTRTLISEGNIIQEVKEEGGKEKIKTFFPGSRFNGIAHVRPHGKDSTDTAPLPIPDRLTGRNAHSKQCFWLNAAYIQQAIESAEDQD